MQAISYIIVAVLAAVISSIITAQVIGIRCVEILDRYTTGCLEDLKELCDMMVNPHKYIRIDKDKTGGKTNGRT